MLNLTLQIRFGTAPRRATAAWFIPCSEPAACLHELAEWQVPLNDLTLHVVPCSRADLRPAGVLVTAPQTLQPKASLRSHAYGCLASRLYIPVEAILEPEVTEPELTSLLGLEYQAYLFHPAIGLVGFERGDALRVSQLLAAPRQRAADWGHAQPAGSFNSRLISVEPREPPSVQYVLEEGKGDIGSQSDSLDQMPAAPNESSPGSLAGLGEAARASLAKAVLWLTNLAPNTAGSRTWINDVSDWAREMLSTAGQGLAAARRRELERLMHLLETRPDEGLRFALPLTGDAHRGVAPPTWQLGEHDVSFNSRQLGGGLPADRWDVSAMFQQQLAARYRQLASRELTLGRHRRAAYIFAELLGDLQAAAEALSAGRLFREAAILYRDRLHRPWDAAKCLEQGGLLTEALALYETMDSLQAFEKIGEIRERLGEPDLAIAAYRRAAACHLATNNFLQAARVYEDKVHDPEEALQVLASGWPLGNQAEDCLKETFRLLARLGRHHASSSLIDDVSRYRSVEQFIPVFVQVFSDVAVTYPDPETRFHAADATRLAAAEHFNSLAAHDQKLVLRAVARLAPEDRLLARDAERFLTRQAPVVRPLAIRTGEKRTTPPQMLSPVREIVLPAGVEWVCGASNRVEYYVGGYKDGRSVVYQGYWGDESSRGPRGYCTCQSLGRSAMLIAADPQNTRRPLILVSGAPSHGQFEAYLTAATPARLPANVLGAARTAGVWWTVAVEGDAYVLNAYDKDDVLLQSRAYPLLQDAVYQRGIPVPVPLCALPDAVYVGCLNHFAVIRGGDEVEWIDAGDTIHALSESAPYTRKRIALTFTTGGAVYWDERACPRDRRLQPFAKDLSLPFARFTASGWLVAAGLEEYQAYSTSGFELKLAAKCRSASAPFAVLTTGEHNQFAVCGTDGRIRIYAIPQGA